MIVLRILITIAISIVIVSIIVASVAFFVDLFSVRWDKHKPHGLYERLFKRPLDAFLSTGAIIVFSPILLVTGLLVMIKMGTPIFFSQERPGRNGKLFKLYKFRTMTDEKDENGEYLPDELRLPKFGKFLRSTSLDELPELINIVKGDMSIVGPRPLLVQYLTRYNSHQARRHEVRPGLTGLAQINGRNAISWDDKFNWDVQYVDNISFAEDAGIILKTVTKVFKREGISLESFATTEEFMGNEIDDRT